jgi:hypothetical protein
MRTELVVAIIAGAVALCAAGISAWTALTVSRISASARGVKASAGEREGTCPIQRTVATRSI